MTVDKGEGAMLKCKYCKHLYTKTCDDCCINKAVFNMQFDLIDCEQGNCNDCEIGKIKKNKYESTTPEDGVIELEGIKCAIDEKQNFVIEDVLQSIWSPAHKRITLTKDQAFTIAHFILFYLQEKK